MTPILTCATRHLVNDRCSSSFVKIIKMSLHTYHNRAVLVCDEEHNEKKTLRLKIHIEKHNLKIETLTNLLKILRDRCDTKGREFGSEFLKTVG